MKDDEDFESKFLLIKNTFMLDLKSGHSMTEFLSEFWNFLRPAEIRSFERPTSKKDKPSLPS